MSKIYSNYGLPECPERTNRTYSFYNVRIKVQIDAYYIRICYCYYIHDSKENPTTTTSFSIHELLEIPNWQKCNTNM